MFEISTNTLIFVEQGSSTKITVQLTPGNYYDEEITVDIAQSMSNAGTQTYSISINYVTETFNITGSSKSFTIYFTATTLAEHYWSNSEYNKHWKRINFSNINGFTSYNRNSNSYAKSHQEL